MKINFHVLIDSLADLEPDAKVRESTSLDLERVRFPDGSPVHRSYVYVTTPESLPLLSPERTGANVIHLGSRSELDEALPLWRGLVIDPSKLDVQHLLARVLDVFERFDAWERELIGLVAQRSSIEEFLSVGSRVLVNPIALFDASVALVAWAGKLPPERRHATIWDEVLSQGYVGREGLTRFEQRMVDGFRSSVGNDVEVFSVEHYPDEKQCVALLVEKGNLIGQLACVDIVAPFTLGQVSLVRSLRDLLVFRLRCTPDLELRPDSDSAFIDTILSNRDVDFDAASKHLAVIGWRESDSFVIASFRGFDNDSPDAVGWLSIANTVQGKLRPTHVMSLSDGVSAVFKDVDGASRNRSTIAYAAEAVAREQGIRCGISHAFHGFRQMFSMHNQARMAALGATRDHPVALFGDGYLDAILASLPAGFDSRALCYPAIMEVIDSTPAGIENAQSLYAYLALGRNASAAASELHIHRNTLNYRIGRIAKLSGVDVDGLTSEQSLMAMITCVVAMRGARTS